MSSITRRRFVQGLATLPCLAGLAPVRARSQSPPDAVHWHQVQQWGVEGRGWSDVKRYYDRLPGRAAGRVRSSVWNLSRHSAGMSTRFTSDATTIHVRYRLFSGSLAMAHMPATGVSGVDLYARDSDTWRWVAVTRPGAQDVSAVLADGLKPTDEPREFLAYLPLYNGIESLEFGVPTGATFAGVPPRTEKPIVFYGTSIMHGACASRPGMSITGILGRRLNRPTINLGFSGNGRMELAVAELLVELEAAVYVIDCLPNLTAEQITARTIPLIKKLRAARPSTPILMVEDRTYADSWIRGDRDRRNRESRLAFRGELKKLASAGFDNIHLLAGDSLLGTDNEATTDGSHPNDLGMMRYAEAYAAALTPLLTVDG